MPTIMIMMIINVKNEICKKMVIDDVSTRVKQQEFNISLDL